MILMISLNIIFSLLVIVSRHALYSLVSLIIVILCSCIILFLLKIEFLTFILILIYIGAIIILFLFIIMMLPLVQSSKYNLSNFLFSKDFLIYLFIFLKGIFFFFFFNKKLCFSLNLFSIEYIKYNKDIEEFSSFLLNDTNQSLYFLVIYTQKFSFFLIIGFILFFSMISSIALCLTSNKNL